MSFQTNSLPGIYAQLGTDASVDQIQSKSAVAGFLHLIRLRLKTDEHLATALSTGDADALTILFERHGALVFRIARRVLHNDADAEDATQQVFIDVYRAVTQFDSTRGSFRAWLLMFAYHRTFNHRRRLQRETCFLTESLTDEMARFPIVWPNPQTRLTITQALAQLRPLQRRIIELTYYEGHTASEIAQSTGLSVRVVRHNLYRGLEKLRLVMNANLDVNRRPVDPVRTK